MSGALFVIRFMEFRDIRGEILKKGEGKTNMTTGERKHVYVNTVTS